MNKRVTVRTWFKLAAMAGFVALSTIAASAQDTGNQHLDEGSQKMLKSPDVAFAMKAAQGEIAEVQMGQLAAQNASNPDVKAFGQRMVDDHTKANDKLKGVAQAQNMTLPESLDAKHQTEYAKLQGLSGPSFDREYVKCMVKDHEEDVKEFQKEANTGKDPQIKAFASETLPVLEQHLSQIKSIQAGTSGAASSK
jgi:putative membrane protein